MASSSIRTSKRKAQRDAPQELIPQNEQEGIVEELSMLNSPAGNANVRNGQLTYNLQASILEYFPKIPQTDGKVVCIKCSKQFDILHGSIEGLKSHLIQNHAELWMKVNSTRHKRRFLGLEIQSPDEQGDSSDTDTNTDHRHQHFIIPEVGQEEQPVKQRAKRSYVWEYYIDGPVKEGSNTAICRLCCQQIKWKPHSTSSLGRHLKHRHPGFSNQEQFDHGNMSTLAIHEDGEISVREPPEEYLEHSFSVGSFLSNESMDDGEIPSLGESDSVPSGSTAKNRFLRTSRPCGRTSIFWYYFFDASETRDSNVAVCKECHLELKWKNRKTKCMERHLKRKHPKLWQEACSFRAERFRIINSQDTVNSHLLSNNPEESQPAPDSTASAHVKVEPVEDNDFASSALLHSYDGHLRIKSVLRSEGNPAKDPDIFQPQDSRQLALDLAICELVVSTGLTFSWLGTKGFKKFMTHACPQAIIKQPETIVSERLPILFENSKANVRKILSDEVVNGKTTMLGILTCSWISPNSTKFLSVTCQYVTPEWENRRILLQSQENSQVSICLSKILEDFLYPDENFQCRKSSLISETDTSNAFFYSADKNLEIDHIVPANGAIEAAFQHSLMRNELFAQAIDVANRFIDAVSYSKELFRVFETECNTLKIKQKKLKRSTQSLSSHIKMISSILEIRKVIEAMNGENYSGQLGTVKLKIPSLDQIEGLENLLPVLKRIQSVIDKLTNEKNPTSPLVIPLLMILEAYLKSIQFKQIDPLKKFIDLFVEELNNQLPKNGKQVKAFRMACFLHPVYRGFPLEDPDGNTFEFENAKRDIIASHPSTRKWQAEVDAVKANILQDIESKQSEVDPSCSSSDILPNIFLKRMKASHALQEQTSPIETEIQAFLSLPNRPEAVDDIDILEWWRSNKETFPNLAEVAREVFSIPATSVSGESIYSSVEKMVLGMNQDLNPCTVNMITFIQNNEKHFKS